MIDFPLKNMLDLVFFSVLFWDSLFPLLSLKKVSQQFIIYCSNVSICRCHSLSEQMIPAANLAADFWQLTVLWCWHWLRDISLPVHFTPLITISVTLLLSQYQVSLGGVRQQQTDEQTQTQCIDQEITIHKRSCREFSVMSLPWKTDVHDSLLAAHWGHGVMLSLWSLEDNNFMQLLSDSIIASLTGRPLNSTPIKT